ncbi:hypothetical protein ABFT80_21675 [Mesorhizobium sp. SB112]|uniref:hypothetical protein n=1 Tax=Mesorhizobium sp. SB112 TaxID=3151853 RepID=UPI0032676441
MNQQSIHDRIMSRKDGGAAVEETPEVPREPKKRWVRTALISVAGIAVGIAAGIAAMQFSAVKDVFAQDASVAAGGPNAALPDTPFLAHAKQAGLTTCGTVFPVLGQILGDGAQYDVHSEWNQTEPNKHAVQALVGMNYATESYSGAAAGVVFASPNGSACEGAMVRIAPFSMKCQDVLAGFPEGAALVSNLGQVPLYKLPRDGGQVLLIPSGESCTVVSVVQAAG